MNEPLPTPDAIACLEAFSRDLAALEQALERWRAAATDSTDERERARRAALQMRVQVSRIAAMLAPPVAESASAPWHSQERRSPHRATNVARLPERPVPATCQRPPDGGDWSPYES